MRQKMTIKTALCLSFAFGTVQKKVGHKLNVMLTGLHFIDENPRFLASTSISDTIANWIVADMLRTHY